VLLALAVAPVCAGWLATPRPLHAQAPVPVAEAFTAAWNAHDLPAVLALFAPDAVVRERRGDVPPHVWGTRDPQVALAHLDGAADRGSYDPDGFAWVTGRPQIAAWAAVAFAHRHRYVAGPYRAAGDTVGWPYRAFADPYQLLPGVGPTDGDAEAVVRGGRITTLSLVGSSESLRRRGGEADASYARAMATRRAAPDSDEPSVPLSGPPRAAEPAPVGWPLALGGLALLAVVTVTLRRGRLS
jgi:hypothetical protein